MCLNTILFAAFINSINGTVISTEDKAMFIMLDTTRIVTVWYEITPEVYCFMGNKDERDV
jgi:hypothetical protein